jgi:5-methylcytosine-specific restriction enzyme A
MPWKAKQPCTHQPCPELTDGGPCERHRLSYNKRRDAIRPNASSRGYTSVRWRRLRRLKLATDPLCEECGKAGRVTAATEVDHLVPHDGPADPLFWEWSNLSSKCKPCHSRKTATQDSGFAKRGSHGR